MSKTAQATLALLVPAGMADINFDEGGTFLLFELRLKVDLLA